MNRNPNKPTLPTTRRRCNVCIAILATISAAVLLLLILALTVLRPKQSITTVRSVTLEGIKMGFDAPDLGLDLNVTVLLGLSVTNPNGASFRFDAGSSELYYRGALVGDAAIPPGEIGPHETIDTDAMLVVMASRLAASDKAYADLLSGTLSVSTYTRIPGKVTLMRMFRHRMTMYTTCDVVIDTMARRVANSDCRSRTKL